MLQEQEAAAGSLLNLGKQRKQESGKGYRAAAAGTHQQWQQTEQQ